MSLQSQQGRTRAACSQIRREQQFDYRAYTDRAENLLENRRGCSSSSSSR